MNLGRADAANSNRELRLMNRIKKSEELIEITQTEESTQMDARDLLSERCGGEHLIDKSDSKEAAGNIEELRVTPSTSNIGVQVMTDFLRPRFVNLITTDELSTVTGIESFKILQIIVNLVEYAFGDMFKHHNDKISVCDTVVPILNGNKICRLVL